MRLLSILFLSLSISYSSQAQENYVLTSKVDPQLKAVVQSLMGLVIQQIPSVNAQSQFALNDSTNLQAGAIIGDLSLQIDNATGVALTSEAQVKVELLNAENDSVLIVMTTTGSTSGDQIINLLQGHNAVLCPAGSTNGCSENLVSAEESGLSPSQKSALAFEKFKANLITSLSSSGGGEQIETFGEPTQAASGPLTPEVSQLLITAIQNGLTVNATAGETTLLIDVLQFAPISSSVSVALPAFSTLSALSGLEVKVTDAEATFVVEAQSLIPARVVRAYDEFLTSEQNKGGMVWLQDLFNQYGPWLISNCAESDKTAWCIDEFLNNCGKDAGAVGFCMQMIPHIKAGKDVQNATTKTLDDIGNAINCMFGCPEPVKPE